MLLLDEPLGALDLKLRKQMQVELKRIQQEVGITFIYVTHDQEEAMTMSDRIAVMNKGRYEQLGDPESLYERPHDPLRGGLPRRQQPARRRRSTGTPTGYAVARLADDTRVRVPSALVDGVRQRRGRRPAGEDPAARADRPTVPAAHNQLHGRRSATRRTSACQHAVHRRGPRRRPVTVYEQNVERATRAELWTPGEEVQLTWSPDHTFVVDEPMTGRHPPAPRTAPADARRRTEESP